MYFMLVFYDSSTGKLASSMTDEVSLRGKPENKTGWLKQLASKIAIAMWRSLLTNAFLSCYVDQLFVSST